MAVIIYDRAEFLGLRPQDQDTTWRLLTTTHQTCHKSFVDHLRHVVDKAQDEEIEALRVRLAKSHQQTIMWAEHANCLAEQANRSNDLLRASRQTTLELRRSLVVKYKEAEELRSDRSALANCLGSDGKLFLDGIKSPCQTAIAMRTVGSCW